MKKYIVLFFGFGMISLSVLAGNNSGADFLKIPIGARSVGLGQATTAGLSGVESLNWNPAGIAVLSNSKMTGLTFSHQQLLGDNTLNHFGIAVPRSRSTFGFNVLRLSYLQQEQREQDRRVVGSFSPSDMSVGMTMAHSFSQVQLGAKVKWISQKLASEKSDGYAVDLGLLSKTPIAPLMLGMSVQNWGPSMSFISESYHLPLTVSMGGRYQVASPLALSLDFVRRPYQHQTSLAFGAELITTSLITLRAGYLTHVAQALANQQRSETNRGNIAGIGGLSAGMGIHLNQFKLDYAFAPTGELGVSHMITLSTQFSSQNVRQAIELPSPSSSENKMPLPETKEGNSSTTPSDRKIIIFDSQTDSMILPDK